MYARDTKFGEVTLAVSGKLWEMGLVMIDEETESLWSQLLGRAMRGPLEGSQLEVIPSVITDWGSWRNRHPETTVLASNRTTYDYTRDMQLRSDDLMLGIVDENESRAWQLTELRKQPVVNDRFAGRPLLIVHDPKTGTMVMHGRMIDETELHFSMAGGELLDRETNTRWDLLTGEATQGELQGRRLPAEAAIVSNEYAWSVFHPESSYWVPGSELKAADTEPHDP